MRLGPSAQHTLPSSGVREVREVECEHTCLLSRRASVSTSALCKSVVERHMHVQSPCAERRVQRTLAPSANAVSQKSVR